MLGSHHETNATALLKPETNKLTKSSCYEGFLWLPRYPRLPRLRKACKHIQITHWQEKLFYCLVRLTKAVLLETHCSLRVLGLQENV